MPRSAGISDEIYKAISLSMPNPLAAVCIALLLFSVPNVTTLATLSSP